MGGTLGPSPKSATLAVTIIPVSPTGGVATPGTAGVPLGVYSNHHDWNRTVGNQCSLPGELTPLWYAHYDRDPSTCTDFLPFGGWSRPFAKQYSDHSAMLDRMCGISPDTSITCG